MGYLSTTMPIMAILLLAFSNVSAASLDLKKPLTLKDCIYTALENSSKITIAKRSLTTAESGVKDARAGYLPRLDASADYKINDTYNKIAWTENQRDVRLSMTEIFYDNGNTTAQIKQAKARLESATADFQKIQDELTIEVIKSYYAFLKAQGMLKVKDEGLKQSQTHLNLAKARYEAGVAPKSDILKAEVEVSTAELGLIEAENTISLTQADLNNCLGIDLDTPLLILDTKESEPIALTIDECLAYALKNRPEIKKAEISLKIDEINLKLAQKEVLPIITMAGNYNTNVDQFINERDWNKASTWGIDIKVGFPIFDADKAKRGVTKATINMENIKTNNSQLEKDITLEVSRLYLTLKSQQKMIETAKKQVVQAKESFDAAQGRYSSGVAPIIEVIDAQSSLNNASTNFVKAIYDYQMAIFSLKKAIGGQIL
ncbi:MAG: TolC family protein [Candidatus Desantisbacteria bacterium]